MSTTINKEEIQKFSKLSEEWWDVNGKFKPLHMFNPIRIEYITENIKKHWVYDQFLFHPDDIPFEQNSLPNVFTVFRKICEKNVEIRKPLLPLSAMPKENLLNYVPPIPTLEDLGYEKIFWDNRTAIPFRGGEQEGLLRLDEYFWKTCF